MATTTITDLPNASTPLGPEYIVLDQGGETKKLLLSDLFQTSGSETITSLTQNGNVLSYTNETGVVNIINVLEEETPETLTSLSLANGVLTYTDETSKLTYLNVTQDETVTSLSLLDGVLSYTDEVEQITNLTLIPNESIEYAKLSTGAPTWDAAGSVNAGGTILSTYTDTLFDPDVLTVGVELGLGMEPDDGLLQSFIDFHAGSFYTDYAARIWRRHGGVFEISQRGPGPLRLTTAFETTSTLGASIELTNQSALGENANLITHQADDHKFINIAGTTQATISTDGVPTVGTDLTTKDYVDGTSSFTTEDEQSAGYQVFPSGLKMAWGDSTAALDGIITFPAGVGFTVAPTIQISFNKATLAGTYNGSQVGDVTTTNFVYHGSYGNLYGPRYLAIGI